MPDRITVLEAGRELAFSFEDMIRYHGGHSPGGVAHAFKVLERALPLLDVAGRVERRAVAIETAFGGPGARDAFELVTRAVSDGRYTVDQSLARSTLGRTRERFVFRLRHHEDAVLLTLRAGFVTEEFIELTRRDDPDLQDEQRLAQMKADMATRIMSAAAADVYDATPLE